MVSRKKGQPYMSVHCDLDEYTGQAFTVLASLHLQKSADNSGSALHYIRATAASLGHCVHLLRVVNTIYMLQT